MHDRVSTIAATDWGSVPDWIGGIGTATATILLTIGWWRESRHRRHDQERQSAVAIRQLLLDIEDLYTAEREQDGSLNSAADPKLARYRREIDANAALLPKDLRQRILQLSEFLRGNGAIPTFHGDRESLVAHRCTRYGLELVAAYLRNDSLPKPPAFVAEYHAAIEEAEEVTEQHYRELEEQQRPQQDAAQPEQGRTADPR